MSKKAGDKSGDNSGAHAEQRHFDQTFAEISKPKLLAAINVAAHLHYLGEATFAGASSLVMRIALRLGASSLSAAAFADLGEWIDNRLCARITLEAPPQGWLSRGQLNRIRNDIAQQEERGRRNAPSPSQQGNTQ